MEISAKIYNFNVFSKFQLKFKFFEGGAIYGTPSQEVPYMEPLCGGSFFMRSNFGMGCHIWHPFGWGAISGTPCHGVPYMAN